MTFTFTMSETSEGVVLTVPVDVETGSTVRARGSREENFRHRVYQSRGSTVTVARCREHVVRGLFRLWVIVTV